MMTLLLAAVAVVVIYALAYATVLLYTRMMSERDDVRGRSRGGDA